jgi:hypothetical protein
MIEHRLPPVGKLGDGGQLPLLERLESAASTLVVMYIARGQARGAA